MTNELKFIPFAFKLKGMTAQQFTDKVFALPPEARQHAEEFVDYLQQKYAPTAREQKLPALEDEPCFGMWSARDDMADSTEYVRELRRKQWGDNS